MELLAHQNSLTTMDSVVLDIESLMQSSDKNSRALARKGSCRMERRCGNEEEEIDLPSKKLLIKVNSHLEPLITTKAAPSTSPTKLTEMNDGRSTKRFNRFINPRKILLMFATVSSMGTMILIYFTLAIYRSN